MMSVASFKSSSQILSDTICVETRDFDAMLSTIVSLRAQVQTLELLKADTANLNNIIALQEKEAKRSNDFNRRLTDSLTSAINQRNIILSGKDEIIRQKEKTLQDYGKPKRWGIGPAALYGLSGATLGIAVGIGVSYSIFRF